MLNDSLIDLPETDEHGYFTKIPGGHPLTKEVGPYFLGDQVHLNCYYGYTRPGEYISKVVQQGDALTWDRPRLFCQPVACPHPNPPLNGYLKDINPSKPNRAFRYVCHFGYHLNQPNTSYYCMPSGSWTPKLPSSVECVPIKCPELRAPSDGTLSFTNDRFFKSVATVTCDRDTVLLEGDRKRMCQKDGTWSGQDVVCGRKPCPPIPDTVHVAHSFGKLKYIACGGGKTVPIKCLPNGEWSIPFPFCGNPVQKDRQPVAKPPDKVPNVPKIQVPPPDKVPNVPKIQVPPPDKAPNVSTLKAPSPLVPSPLPNSQAVPRPVIKSHVFYWILTATFFLFCVLFGLYFRKMQRASRI